MPNTFINFSRIRDANRLDSEYFQFKFLKLQTKLEKRKYKKLHELCEFIQTGPAGSALQASSYVESGIKIYRPSNLNGWTCNNNKIVYIDKKNCLKLYRSGDILVTRIGDVKFGIIEGVDSAVISPNLVAIRTKKYILDPFFLLAYLNTDFGFEQINRSIKTASLSSVGIDQIANILVPNISIKEQNNISDLVKNALSKKRKAISLYEKAENILLDAIKWQGVIKNDHADEINHSKLRDALRADAEYFINNKNDNHYKIRTLKLGDIATVFRGIEAGQKNYKNAGKLFLRTSNISKYGFLNKSQKYISEELYNKFKLKYQPQTGEILLVKDGKPGVALTIRDEVAGVIAEGIVRLKLNNNVDAEYAALCINSPFCRAQIERDSDGSLSPHWKVGQIEKLQIPIVANEIQNELIKFVRRSFSYFQDVNQYFAEAKLLLNKFFISSKSF